MVFFGGILYYCYDLAVAQVEETKPPPPPPNRPKPRPHNNRPINLNNKKNVNKPNSKLPLVRKDLRDIAEYYIGGRRMTAHLSSHHVKHSRSSKKEDRPNFVLIVLDDSGYGDLGVNNLQNGNKNHVSHTPFLDSLATKGLRLTDFYVTCSICTPSRASIMTGRYGPRTGVVGHVAPKSKGGLPANEMTIAEHLKPLGYDSIILGKWHLGMHGYFFTSFDQ